MLHTIERLKLTIWMPRPLCLHLIFYSSRGCPCHIVVTVARTSTIIMSVPEIEIFDESQAYKPKTSR